jgi:hypothetical protein
MRITKERYVLSHSGQKVAFTASTPDALIRSVQQFVRLRAIQLSDDDVAKLICKSNGYEHKDGLYSKTIQPVFNKPSLNLASVKAACGAMLQTIKGNNVSDAEIARRWEICKNCPAKTNVSDCMSCGGSGRVASWIQSIKGAAGKMFRLEQEAGMTFCGLCGCSHALLTTTKMEFQKPESEKQNQQRPEQCWLRYDSQNYKP